MESEYATTIVIIAVFVWLVMLGVGWGFAYEAGVRHGQRQQGGTWAYADNHTAVEPTADVLAEVVAEVTPPTTLTVISEPEPETEPVVDRPQVRVGRHRYSVIAEGTQQIPVAKLRKLVAA